MKHKHFIQVSNICPTITLMTSTSVYIIQLLTSISADIRICQPEKVIFNEAGCQGEYHLMVDKSLGQPKLKSIIVLLYGFVFDYLFKVLLSFLQ